MIHKFVPLLGGIWHRFQCCRMRFSIGIEPRVVRRLSALIAGRTKVGGQRDRKIHEVAVRKNDVDLRVRHAQGLDQAVDRSTDPRYRCSVQFLSVQAMGGSRSVRIRRLAARLNAVHERRRLVIVSNYLQENARPPQVRFAASVLARENLQLTVPLTSESWHCYSQGSAPARRFWRLARFSPLVQ